MLATNTVPHSSNTAIMMSTQLLLRLETGLGATGGATSMPWVWQDAAIVTCPRPSQLVFQIQEIQDFLLPHTPILAATTGAEPTRGLPLPLLPSHLSYYCCQDTTYSCWHWLLLLVYQSFTYADCCYHQTTSGGIVLPPWCHPHDSQPHPACHKLLLLLYPVSVTVICVNPLS